MAAQKTFRMLNAIIDNGGDLLEEGKPNPAERSWLRLAAGCAMLKICEQKGVGDQFTTEQYYTLSRLVTDPVIQVREHFLGKLHKGLSRGLPNKCLPLDFMGLFALAGLEADKRLRGLAKNFMVNNINKRREYMKSVIQGGGEKASAQLPHIMPDYMLVFAVPVLTHDLNFTSHTDVEYLKRIRLALWFVLEPLMTKNENYSFGFYQELIQKMKNHKDAFKGDDEAVNQKLWAVCDLAMGSSGAEGGDAVVTERDASTGDLMAGMVEAMFGQFRQVELASVWQEIRSRKVVSFSVVRDATQVTVVVVM